MRTLLSSALLLALSGSTLAVSNTFTYQGTLTDAGLPAHGSYDLRFDLIGVGEEGGYLYRDDIAVVDGVFSVELEFGTAIDSGDFELEVAVRPGDSSGSYTVLSPTTPIRPTPQAQVAGLAGEAVSVSPDAVTSAGIADGSIGASDVDATQIQRRVSGVCAENEAIRAIHGDGTVSCEIAGGGSGVTSVDTGSGLTGGPITGSGTISIAVGGVTSGHIQDGVVGSADIAPDEVQRRVSGSCPAGSAIRNVDNEGAVSCTTVSALAWSLSGNAGTNPGTNFIGTTDALPLVLRAGNREALRITPRSAFDGPGFSNTANLLGGSGANQIGAGSRGVIVLGGGADPGSEGFLFFNEPNAGSDHYTTVLGGIGNRAGSGGAGTARYATVVGGESNNATGEAALTAGGALNSSRANAAGILAGRNNVATGAQSAIAGGTANTASGAGAVVLGGDSNCAGGQYSFAAGRGANVRPHSGVVGGGCEAITNSGDANGDEGSFVWADATSSAGFTSTGPNQFLVRADGGMMLNTNETVTGGDDLVVGARAASGDADADLRLRTRSGRSVLIYASDLLGSLRINIPALPAGNDRISVGGGAGGNATLSNGGTWTNASSRSYKTDIEPVDGRDVLERLVALDVSRWNYIGSGEGTHMGPMAEDFKAAFDLAGDGKSIATVDADGVALAAIQGLNQKLEQENAELRARLDAIEALLHAKGAR